MWRDLELAGDSCLSGGWGGGGGGGGGGAGDEFLALFLPTTVQESVSISVFTCVGSVIIKAVVSWEWSLSMVL